jgi:hypothetical protein
MNRTAPAIANNAKYACKNNDNKSITKQIAEPTKPALEP